MRTKQTKQKNNEALEEIRKYVQEVNPKVKIAEAAECAGYRCCLTTDAVLVFNNYEKKEEIEQWLLKNYGKEENGVSRVPLSYGFIINNEVSENV